MEPRLESSAQWTSFPPEYLQQVCAACEETFKDSLEAPGKFIAEGRIYREEIVVRIGFLPDESLRQINAEVSVNYNVFKENVKDVMSIAIDCAGTLLQQGIQAGLSSLPQLWQEQDFEGREVFFQFSGTNTELERMADQLLGESTDQGLVKGDESVEQITRRLGLLN